jgi:hypothetical protein
VERNQIFDNLAIAGHTIAGLVATLLEGKKSDLLGPFGASGADGTFSFAVQKSGGKSNPILEARLRPSKLVGYLDGHNPRPRHRRKPYTTYAAITAAPLSGDLEFRVIEAGLPGLEALAGIRRVARPHGATLVRAKRMRDGF